MHGQPRVGEYGEHRPVLRQRLGHERAQPALPPGRHKVLKQQGRDPPAMHVVGHREGDLGDPRLGRGLIARHPDQPVTEAGEQRGVVWPGLPAHPAGLALRVVRAQAEEAQVQVVG